MDCGAVEGAIHAWCCALFLTVNSGNDFGSEGARMITTTLGKLTALQRLYLEGTIFLLHRFEMGCVGIERVAVCFLLIFQAATLGLKGQYFSRSRSAN
jgi:hypothetical protein